MKISKFPSIMANTVLKFLFQMETITKFYFKMLEKFH